MLFFLLSIFMLIFNFYNVLLLLLGVEVFVLSVFLLFLTMGSSLSFYYLFMSVVGSCFSLVLLVSLVKSYGSDLVNFCVLVYVLKYALWVCES